MGKRVIFALVLLVLMVTLGLLSQLWLQRFCSRQCDLIQAGELQQARREWLEAEPWVACLVGHEELNQAGDCYAELLGTPPENRKAIQNRLLYWLWAIAQYDCPGLRSIL